jgi:NTP pyrophosphatase (non-canonical NTP hydrolase)
MSKLLEEVQELSDGLLRNDTAEICDAIGDIQVVLAVMCAQLGQDIDACREMAWEQIKDRKGKMVDGVFVKEKQRGWKAETWESEEYGTCRLVKID